MPGDEDYRGVYISVSQFALEVQPAQPRQPHIQDQTAGPIRAAALQELPRRRECRDLQPHRTDQTLQRLTNGFIIIDYEYGCVHLTGLAGNQVAFNLGLELQLLLQTLQVKSQLFCCLVTFISTLAQRLHHNPR